MTFEQILSDIHNKKYAPILYFTEKGEIITYDTDSRNN